ncbi:MAG: LysE family translocator [Burkholderiales bacterium]|jgi:threonine/homoserine/homoserine lactone efflux protein|nr:LysE family translocator [Burkholderiales bacterium]
MIPAHDLLLFAGAAVLIALTPGPNMIYVTSRSISQGRRAGVTSLLGVIVGFLAHMFAAAAGLTALFLAVPLAYEILKWAGAAYLLWMAWQAVKPGASSPFEMRSLPPDSPRRLFAMGLITNLLNPKIAVFYLAVFPQFVSPAHGSVFAQSLVLGFIQIVSSFAVNFTLVMCAGGLAGWFARHPVWMAVQRWVTGSVLAALAVRLALEPRRGA